MKRGPAVGLAIGLPTVVLAAVVLVTIQPGLPGAAHGTVSTGGEPPIPSASGATGAGCP